MKDDKREVDATLEPELDPEIAARLEGAPRTAHPARDLWPAIMKRIEIEERPREVRSGAPAGLGMRAGRARILAAALKTAAALAIFAIGVAVGQRWNGLQGESGDGGAADPLRAATEVQRAGSEYVAALAQLSEIPDDSRATAQGYEAALSTLQGAAFELVRMSEGSPETSRIFYTVSEARSSASGAGDAVHF